MNIHPTLVGVGTDELCSSVLPLEVIRLIASYIVEPKMKLLDWIPLDKIYWYFLSYNPNAIHLLEKNMDKVDWLYLLKNPNAIHLIEQDINMIELTGLSENPNAIHLIEQNIKEVDWVCQFLYILV